MPAAFWGHLDPEREELRNALLRAQTRQMETQTSLAQMLGAQGAGVGAPGGVEDDEFQWEELEFKKEQLEEQTKLAKAQQLILERDMTLKEEEAQAPFTMGLGEMLLSAEGEPQVVPGKQVGGAFLDPLTGVPKYQEPIVAGLEQTVIRPDTGETLKIGMIKTPKGSLVTSTGETIYSEPEVTVSGSQMIITDPSTGDVINTIDITQVPRGFDVDVDNKGNVYTTNLDTGETELVAPSAYYEQEYKQKERTLKVQQFGIEVESKGYDVELFGMNLEAHITQKGYDRDIDVQLIKQDIQDSVNLTTIEKQVLMNKADELAAEVTDRRTDAMLVGYDVDKYGHDVRRYAADVGYDETIDGNMIIRDIQNSKNATDKEKQELIALTSQLSDESAERRNTATIEASDRKLVADRYVKGYVPQSAEDALAYVRAKARIEAQYAPFTTPNMMNEPDARDYVAYTAGLELFVEKGKTDEKLRFEFGKARATQTPEDLLMGTAVRMMEMTEGAELGRRLLELPLTKEIREREEFEFKETEAALKREGEALGEAREDIDQLQKLMKTATSQIKPTYGGYSKESRALATGVFISLLDADISLSPETKMRYMEIAPALHGMTMAETIDPTLMGGYAWFRGLWEDALSGAVEEVPSETIKSASILDIIRVVNGLGSVKEAKKFLKKFGLSWNEYLDIAEPYLSKEVIRAVEQRKR